MNTLQPKIGQFRGWHVSTKSWVHGHLIGFNIHDEPLIDISEINQTAYVESDSLGQYTGQFAKISPELAAAQPWRDVCPETGLTEIVGGYGPGEKGGDIIKGRDNIHWNIKYSRGTFIMDSIGELECTGLLYDVCTDRMEIIGTAWIDKG